MEIQIRKMRESDLDRIMEIENKCFSSPWSRKSFEFEVNSNALARYIVAENDETLLGYMGIWLMYDEAHIVSIGVDPEFRRNGVGQLLMKAGIDEAIASGMDTMTLEVRKSNTPAKELYRGFGFEPLGIRPKYYQDNNEDAIIMWKYFKDV